MHANIRTPCTHYLSVLHLQVSPVINVIPARPERDFLYYYACTKALGSKFAISITTTRDSQATIVQFIIRPENCDKPH